MAWTAGIDGGGYPSVSEPGFGMDIRPGLNPEEWEADNVYFWPTQDPVKYPSPITLMPATEHPDWETTVSDTGVYARDRLSHYTQLSGANSFEEFTHLHMKDYVFLSRQQNAQLVSQEFAEAGSGLAFNLWAAGTGKGFQNALTVEFGHTDTSKRFRLNVRQDGRGFLARGAGINPEDQLAEGWLVPNRWGSIVGRWLKIYILPHGRNRLLVSSSAGNGFIWENKGISRKDYPGGGSRPLSATPSLIEYYGPVTKSAPYVITVPPKAAVQPSIINFTGNASDGKINGTLTRKTPNLLTGPYVPAGGPSVLSAKKTFDTPPLTAFFPVTVAFTPSADTKGRWNLQPTVTLSRPAVTKKQQRVSPILYRVEPSVPPVPAFAAPSATDIMPDIIHLSHSHDKEALSGELKIRNGQNHTAYWQAFNIPFELKEDGNEYLKSVLIEPKWTWDGDQKFITWTMGDWWKYLEETPLGSLGRLDGMMLSDAMKVILKAVGFPSDGSRWDIHDTSATSSNGEAFDKLSKGEADDAPTHLPDLIRSAADWIKYIRDQTSSAEAPFQWLIGFQPVLDVGSGLFKWKFVFWDPARISSTPVKTLFPTHALAVTNGGSTWAQSHRSVTEQEWTEEAVEPEANEVQVFGLTPDDKPLKAMKRTKPSQDRTLALADRPSNWLGYRKVWVEVDGAFNTQELVNAACLKLFYRMSRARKRANLKAQWEPSVTRGTTMRIYITGTYPGVSGTDYYDYKVMGFSISDHLQELDGGGLNRVIPCTYQLERWI